MEATDYTDIIRTLPRERVVELLESISIQCYDTETVDVLREALNVAIRDGDLGPHDLV